MEEAALIDSVSLISCSLELFFPHRLLFLRLSVMTDINNLIFLFLMYKSLVAHVEKSMEKWMACVPKCHKIHKVRLLLFSITNLKSPTNSSSF